MLPLSLQFDVMEATDGKDNSKLNKEQINDDEETKHILSSSQSKDGEVPPSPRLANQSSSGHGRVVPEVNIPSTSSSHDQGSSAGHNAIYYHHHDHHYHGHPHPHFPVGQVKRRNESPSDAPSPMVL